MPADVMHSRFEIPLRPATHHGVLPPGPALGRLAHGWFLRGLVEPHDAALAAELHDETRPVRPFTLALLPLAARGAAPAGYACRVTAFWPHLSAVLREALADLFARGEGVSLGELTFRLDAPARERRLDPETLVSRWLERPPPRTLRVTFVTPATFRVAYRAADTQVNRLFPWAASVLAKPLERWNLFGTREVKSELLDWVADHVVESRYELHTTVVNTVRRRPERGFSGFCEYTLLPNEPEPMRIAGMLADFARWSGVGAKLARGFGQVDVLVDGASTPGVACEVDAGEVAPG